MCLCSHELAGLVAAVLSLLLWPICFLATARENKHIEIIERKIERHIEKERGIKRKRERKMRIERGIERKGERKVKIERGIERNMDNISI